VNAAGIAVSARSRKTDFAAYRRSWRSISMALISVVTPPFRYCASAAGDRQSVIVLGLIGGQNLCRLQRFEGGVSLLTKSVALHGARYNAAGALQRMCGFIDGPMWTVLREQTRSPDVVRGKLVDDIHSVRLAAEKLLRSACFCCGASSFITGACADRWRVTAR